LSSRPLLRSRSRSVLSPPPHRLPPPVILPVFISAPSLPPPHLTPIFSVHN
jgi:hypothetical protein